MLLVDASVPPQQIDLDCANWLNRNKVSTSILVSELIVKLQWPPLMFCHFHLFQIGITFVFTKCDKVKGGKGSRPNENIKHFQDLVSKYYQEPPPWIMTSSITGLGRDELLLHMSQLKNYWDN